MVKAEAIRSVFFSNFPKFAKLYQYCRSAVSKYETIPGNLNFFVGRFDRHRRGLYHFIVNNFYGYLYQQYEMFHF